MRTGTPYSVYLDANALIRFIEGDDRGFVFLVELSVAGMVNLHTSELTFLEVLVGPLKHGQASLIAVYEDIFAANDTLSIGPITREILRRAAEIQASFGNKGADAIHVASAVAAGCSVFLSSDKRIKLPTGLTRLDVDAVEDLEGWP